MIRKIIKIDEEKCNGCGLCASACHEGAIDIIDGKAKLVRENFCDGFGDCLPNCPTGAITFEEREAPAYDEAAVKAAQQGAKDGNDVASCGRRRTSCRWLPRFPYDAVQTGRGRASARSCHRIPSCFPSEPVALPDQVTADESRVL